MNAAKLYKLDQPNHFGVFGNEAPNVPSPQHVYRVGQDKPFDTLEELALTLVELASNLKSNSLVLIEHILFKDCVAQYMLPVLEDTSGLKHGEDFWIGLRVYNKVSFYATEIKDLLRVAEEAVGAALLPARSFKAMEEMLLGKNVKLKINQKNDLVSSLNQAGVYDTSAKILLQGTQLERLSGTSYHKRLQAIEQLAQAFPKLEIHDPYLTEEGDLNAKGLHLTLNFSGDYDAVINLSDEPIFSFYTPDFYSEICARMPLFIAFS